MNPQSGYYCNVCGGAFRPWSRECMLRCDRLIYETRRWRQYRRQLELACALDQTPAQIVYNTRRECQYAENLRERAHKAFVVKYYHSWPFDNRNPREWVVPR